MGDPTGRVPRRPGPTRAERVAASSEQQTPRRHCWVAGPDDSPGPWPGLVVEWRRDRGAWVARTIYLVTDRQQPVVVEQWLSADRLRPAR